MHKSLDFSKPYTGTWLKQTGNLFAADTVGALIELGVVSQMARLEAMFPDTSKWMIDSITPTVGYFQKPIEWALDHAKNFEGEEFQKQRKDKTPEERTKDIAHAVVHYMIPVGIGWTTTLATEDRLSRLTKTPHIPKKFWLADGTIHLGLITLMGMPFMAPATQKAKDVVNVVSKVFGADEEQAEDLARLSVVSVVPNYTTLAIVSAGMLRRHSKLAKELEATSALSNT